MSDKLKRYKLDKAFTEGVEIRLDDAPDVVFLVRLPSQYNRGYTQAMYAAIDFDVDDAGKVKAGGALMDAKFAQEDAFIQHCLIAMDLEPVPDDFARAYPRALLELMEKANDLASDIDDRVGESVKKSSPSSTGKKGGQVGKSSTITLNSATG